jgi:hypothetical protein
MSVRSISSSGLWASRSSSARFLAVSFFVEFPFVPGRLACGDDPDEQPIACHRGSRSLVRSNERDATRIVENQLGCLKIHAVLDEVALILFFVSFEANHPYVQISTYTLRLSASRLPGS